MGAQIGRLGARGKATVRLTPSFPQERSGAMQDGHGPDG
jgi:hypothetical protein